MGKKDIVMKDYMGDNRIFPDTFKYLIYYSGISFIGLLLMGWGNRA